MTGQAGKLHAGQCFAVLKPDAHAVLAVNPVLRRALGFDDPGRERFPWHEQGFGGAFRHETDFTALAVEAGGDDVDAFFVVVVPDGQEDQLYA